MKFTEEDLTKYAQPLLASEEEKCKNTIEAVCVALQAYGFALSDRAISLIVEDSYSYSRTMHNNDGEKITVFIQGSYANDTCIACESDVDIAIIRNDIDDSLFDSDFKHPYCTHAQEAAVLKTKVKWALEDKFKQVTKGNKSIKIPGDSNRKKADVVPCIELNFYPLANNKNFTLCYTGIVIYAENGEKVVNFPRHHIINANKKNKITNGKFKRMVRIAKTMRWLMDTYYDSAREISSFEIESLLYNVPANVYAKFNFNHKYIFGEIVDFLYSNMQNIKNFYEVNEIKPLCFDHSREAILLSFIKDLKIFYEL